MGTARCKKCNSLHVRLHKIKNTRQELVGDWEDMDPAKKRQFFLDNHTKYGKDLAANFETTVMETIRKKIIVSFKGSGNFTDLQDLEAKYANKPQQLEAVKKNARKIYDPHREVDLFEDVAYSSLATSEEEYLKEAKHKFMQNQDAKASKRIKLEPAEKKERASNTDNTSKPVTEKQEKRLKSLAENLRKTVIYLEEHVAEIDKSVNLKENVPSYTLRRSSLALAGAKENMAAIEIILEAKIGDAKARIEAASHAKDILDAANKAIEVQMYECREALGGA